jgi:LysM repeat protein
VAALETVLAAAVLIVAIAPTISLKASSRSSVSLPAARRLAPFWIVRPADTFASISAKTGLTVDQLELLNPNVDPQALSPGQRLQLWRHPPPPPPKPAGASYWTVRPGNSFGSIAAKTGINLDTLEQLNPQLKPTALQPGDRVRLRN